MHQTHVLYDESVAAVLEWRVLESGVLAIKTPLEVMTTEGSRCIWFEPRKKRFVCAHGWGQYHLGIWNGPRAADFHKPTWTTCDCKSATGLCAPTQEAARPASAAAAALAAAAAAALAAGAAGWGLCYCVIVLLCVCTCVSTSWVGSG